MIATKHSPQVYLATILAWVALIHSTGLGGEFVFDDNHLLYQESLLDFWSFDWFRVTKRPVATATFAFNFSVFGPTPLSCHVVSIAVHVCAVAALYYLVRQTLLLQGKSALRKRADPVALITALLWGTHPLSTAPVVYIVQRSEALATLFIFLTLFAWGRAFGKVHHDNVEQDKETAGNGNRTALSRHSVAWAFTSVATAYLAYGSKEMTAGLSLVVLLCDRVFIANSWRSIASRWPWYAVLVAPLFVGCYLLLPGMLRPSSGRNTVGLNLPGMTPWSYFTSQPYVFLQYFKLTVLPVHQSLDYGWLPSKDRLVQWIGFGGWGAMGCGTAWLWKRSRPLACSLIAAFIVLAPTSTFIPLQDIIFEHRMYFPLACLIAAFVAWLAQRWSGGLATPDRPTGYARWMLVALLAIPWSALTVSRNMQWWSNLELYQNDVHNNPNNPRAIVGAAGSVEDGSTDPEPTLRALRKAIRISEERDYFYAGTDYKWTRYLADILFLTGRPLEAKPHYEAALEMSYDDLQKTEIVFQLAMIASMQGENVEAERLFQEALAGDEGIRDNVQAVYEEHKRRL